MVYKKATSPTGMVLVFIFFAFFVMFGVGVLYYAGDKVNTIIGGMTGISIGDVNFTSTYENTLGAGIESAISTLSTIALGLIIGMIIVMLIMGYSLRETNRLWIVFDLFLILAAFIIAVYLSRSFDTLMNANGEFFAIYSSQFETSSRLILNLPLITPIIGILVMLVTYAAVKRKEPNVFVPPN